MFRSPTRLLEEKFSTSFRARRHELQSSILQDRWEGIDLISQNTESDEPISNTAEVMVRCLENEGVQYIFGIPGEENLNFLKALQNSSIQFITTRHEQGAAFMADVYGRLTGKPGVCLSTLGPGATNLITGVADANLDGAPLIAITGQVGTDKMHISSHQFIDLVSLFKPITKRSLEIVRPDSVAEIVRLAFKHAKSEKPGAVHINLPENIAAMPVQEEPLAIMSHVEILPPDSSLQKAKDLIEHAKHPMILAGNGAVRQRAGDAVYRMAQKLKIPVANTFMAKGIVPYTSEYSLWTLGFMMHDFIDDLQDQVDLVIAVGYDLAEVAPRRWNKDNKIKIVHVAAEKADTNTYYQPAVEIVGDITDSVNELTRIVQPLEKENYFAEIKQKMTADYEKFAEDPSFPIKPQRILHDARKAMGKEDILISDVGAHKIWVARNYHCYRPNTCIISNCFASMGIAVPGAVAAKLVHPERRVLAVTGDGGFLMNSQELETARRYGLPFVTLIFSDRNYGLIKWKEELKYGQSFNVEFDNPDFKMMAESMGLKGYRIQKTSDLLPTLEEAFRQTVPAVIDCPVDYQENMRLSH